MLPRRLPTLGSLAATVAALALCWGCYHPVRHLSGKVRSVPPTAIEPDPKEVRPLGGVIVKATCGARSGMAFSDPDAGARVLAISRSDGTFEYVQPGEWAHDCALDFQSGDGSHDPRQLAIAELCRQSTGDDECLAIPGITVDLVRRREPSPPLRLSVLTTPAPLDLHVDGARTCQTPCQVQVTPGIHRFELLEQGNSSSIWRQQAAVTANTELTIRYEQHKSRQRAAGWFLLPALPATILLPIGLVRKSDALLWTSAGLAIGGGIGFLLVWKSDHVEAIVRPLPAEH